MKEQEGNCVWDSEEDCVHVTARDRKSIYIFDVFEGVAFENITELNHRVFGPLVVFYCMKYGQVSVKNVLVLVKKNLLISFKLATVYVTTPVGQSAWGIGAELICSKAFKVPLSLISLM